MGSMLGVVLADNLLVLFVFWELTGFTSFLLIGFDQEELRRVLRRFRPSSSPEPAAWGCWPPAVLIQQATGSCESF